MDAAENKPVSAIVANCVSCDGLVRIPITAKANSLVRCPHCAQSFPLQQLVNPEIPELEVVAEVAASPPKEIIPVIDRASKRPSDENTPRQKFVVPHQLSEGAKRKRRHRRRESSSAGSSDPSFSRENRTASPDISIDERSTELGERDAEHSSFEEIDVSASTEHTAKTSARPLRISRDTKRSGHGSRRHRRKASAQPSALAEVLKIAIGGILAFPIAYLMVLWIFGQDPLNLGPPAARIAPWAVPVDLRGAPVPEEISPPESTSDNEVRKERKAILIPEIDINPDSLNGEIDSLLNNIELSPE